MSFSLISVLAAYPMQGHSSRPRISQRSKALNLWYHLCNHYQRFGKIHYKQFLTTSPHILLTTCYEYGSSTLLSITWKGPQTRLTLQRSGPDPHSPPGLVAAELQSSSRNRAASLTCDVIAKAFDFGSFSPCFWPGSRGRRVEIDT